MVSPQCFPSFMGRDGKFTCLALPGACKTPHNPQLWRTSLHPATHCVHLERMKFDAVCTIFQLRFPVRSNPWTDNFTERDLWICAAKSCWKWVAPTATSTRMLRNLSEMNVLDAAQACSMLMTRFTSPCADTGVSVPACPAAPWWNDPGWWWVCTATEGSHKTVVSPQKEEPIHPFRSLK